MDLTGFGSVADFAKSVVDRVWPDKTKALEIKAEIDRAAAAGDLAEHQAAWDNAKAQIAVNVEEAKSSSLFVAGWRPFVGWVCGFSLAYVAIIDPIARFIAQVIIRYVGPFPVIDTTITMQVLLGMLGLAAARSYDKKQGTTTGH